MILFSFSFSRSFLKINEDGVGKKLQDVYADKMQKCEELGEGSPLCLNIYDSLF